MRGFNVKRTEIQRELRRHLREDAELRGIDVGTTMSVGEYFSVYKYGMDRAIQESVISLLTQIDDKTNTITRLIKELKSIANTDDILNTIIGCDSIVRNSQAFAPLLDNRILLQS